MNERLKLLSSKLEPDGGMALEFEYDIGIDWAFGPDRTVIMIKNAKGEVMEIPPVHMHGDHLLVALDPESSKTLSGVLYKPDGTHEHVLRTGTIVKTGPGKWADKPWLKADESARDGTNDDGSPRMVGGPQYRRKPLGVEVGERVLFIKFAVTHTETSKRIQQIVGKDFGMIQPHDILLAGPDVDKVNQ